MENTVFLTAEDVSKQLEISTSLAYRMIRRMNLELQAQGYLTIAGRVDKAYFHQRFFGWKGGAHDGG